MYVNRIRKYKVCPESIETEVVIVKREMKNQWNVHFLKNNSFDTQEIFEFSTKWDVSEILFFVCLFVCLFVCFFNML